MYRVVTTILLVGAMSVALSGSLVMADTGSAHSGTFVVDCRDGGGTFADSGTFVVDCRVLPRLRRVCPDLGAGAKPDSYVDPDARSVGGLTTIQIELNTAVTLVGSVCVTSTGGAPPASAVLNDLGGTGRYEIVFSDPIELAEWTTVAFTAENPDGQGDICFLVGWLPGDCNQDGQLSLADATKFGEEFNGAKTVKLTDFNGDGQVSLTDATKFGQIWTGSSGEGRNPDGTGGWNGSGLPARPACACP